MRDQDIGDVLVQDDGGTLGIVTDRDIVTRVVADGRDPAEVRLSEICTSDVKTVNVDTPVDEVIRVMSDSAIRRIPVCEGNTPVASSPSVISPAIGDRSSLLGDISSAPPNN